MRLQRGIAIVEQRGMRLAGEAQHAGDRDIRMADVFAGPIRRLDCRALFFQHLQHARNLRLAALDPKIELLVLAQHALVQQADALVAKAHRQRANPQVPPPRLAARRDHRFVGADAVVEIIQDHRALDQRLAIVEHQRRHPPQRIIRRDLVGIAKGGPRPMRVGDAIEPHRDGDAADEGGIVLADQEHGAPPFHTHNRHTPRRRSIQYAAAPRFGRNCSGILDPRLRVQLRTRRDDNRWILRILRTVEYRWRRDAQNSVPSPERTRAARRPSARPVGPDRLPVPVEKHHLPVFRLRQAEHAPLRHQRDGHQAAAAGRLRARLRRRLRDERQRPRRAYLPRRYREGQLAAGAWLWRGVAARRVYVHVGANGRDVLQYGATRVLAGKGEAGHFLMWHATSPQQQVVILREGGVSSTPRRLDSTAAALEYWVPAFAGTTAGSEHAQCLTRSPAHAAPHRAALFRRAWDR